jgi:hypothetical protein
MSSMRGPVALAAMLLVGACADATPSVAPPRPTVSAPPPESREDSATAAPTSAPAAPSASAPSDSAARAQPKPPPCTPPRIEPRTDPAASARQFSNRIELEKDGAAPVDKLRRWIGAGATVTDEGRHVVIDGATRGLVARSADGQLIAVLAETEIAVLSPKRGPLWTMRPWLKTWHSNVGDAPGRVQAELAPKGDAVLVWTEAEHGMLTVAAARIVDAPTGRVRVEIPEHVQAWADHAFSPDGTKLAIVLSPDLEHPPALYVFDVQTGRKTESDLRGPVTWSDTSELGRSATPCAATP